MSQTQSTAVDRDNSVKVAVRIRPLNDDELAQDSGYFINPVPGQAQINAGPDTYFTFDYVFGPESKQTDIYDGCVTDLMNATFEGFNSTILAYGQTGSGKTWTMGSSSEYKMTLENMGIIPRVIRKLFAMIRQKETDAPNCSYKVHVQFLEIYGEDMKDLLDPTRTSKVSIRESPEGEVFVSGAKEEQVSSYEQMMKTLEDGSRHRTTASTKMNQTSSRSHETTIRNGAVVMDGDVGEKSEVSSEDAGESQEETLIKHVTYTSQEVRKCKFHFVDLAGSERAKRTGAMGVQLKEGIDINKGLLALGNVISALGDDTKKGKVFVPYRDSKLTRMLQDSLGGNSKTLMICCVSPAYVNFNESVNALRYANRARNIKNKPVVNRDPQLVIIDELKSLLKMISSELLEIRVKKQYIEFEGGVSNAVLENLSSATTSGPVDISNFGTSAPVNGHTATGPSGGHKKGGGSGVDPALFRKLNDEMLILKNRLSDSDFEIRRLTDQLKTARQNASDNNEMVLFAKSERDFYKMKWSEVCPQDAQKLEALGGGGGGDVASAAASSDAMNEKTNVVNVMADHLREIDSLKKQLAMERSNNALAAAANNGDGIPEAGSPTSVRRMLTSGPEGVDEEFTSSIAALIAQTREQLRNETIRLKGFENSINGSTGTEEDGSDAADKNQLELSDAMMDGINDMDEERAFIRRQKILANEVAELGQSIQLKEQLVSQLTRGQHQYVAMKAFYEQKLTTLSTEMSEKQAVRDKLEQELQGISEEKHEQKKLDREKKLREDLRAKDEELKLLKKKQDELHQLSQAQSKYMQQQAKLEADITLMKKQRVDLSKTLQSEKKNHMLDLGNKVKEIERLKRELFKSAGEIKKLGRDKELAETKARDAMREGAAFKKKTQELMKAPVIAPVDPAVASARAAVKAMSRVSRMGANRAKRILNEDELRTKKWLDKRIAEISAREAAADSLKKQYEYQLELLNKRENLEQQKQIALLKSRSVEDSASFVLSPDEEENLVEIEDQLHKINSLISQKNQQIDNIQQQIENAGDVAEIDKTIEALKKSAAGSLPASHELIRLLFDMLVNSSKTIQEKIEQIDEQKSFAKQLEEELDERREAIESEKRIHDMELTRAANEYEQHLSNLFSNMVTLSPTLLPTASSSNLLSPASPFRESTGGGGSSSQSSALDPTKLQLAISTEESKFLRSQLQRQSLKSSQFQAKLADLEKLKSRLEKDLEEKSIQIRFLEEERSLFKDLADDLKQGLASMGKPGKTIVDSVRDLAAQRRKSGMGLFSEYMSNDFEDNGSDTLDSESVLGEFEFLADEINRTGGISVYSSHRAAASGFAASAVNGSNGNLAGAGLHQNENSAKPIVYDRLTNPSNFTGHMKNVFNKDIEEKRKKIKEIRYHERSSVGPKNPAVLHQNSNGAATFSGTPTAAGGINMAAARESWPRTNADSTAASLAYASHRRDPAGSGGSHKFTFEGSGGGSDGNVSTGTVFSSEEDSTKSHNSLNNQPQQEDLLPQNVFSRLSTSYTGISKHRKDDLNVSISSLPNPTGSTTVRSHSPMNRAAFGVVPTPRKLSHPPLPMMNGGGEGAHHHDDENANNSDMEQLRSSSVMSERSEEMEE